MKILKLTLRKIWFDMIASGEKTEEYREIKKFWLQRFTETYPGPPEMVCVMKDGTRFEFDFISEFDQVEFTNGYGKHRPKITLECKGIHIGTGKPELGAEHGGNYFVIKLGKMIEYQNLPADMYGTMHARKLKELKGGSQ